LVYGGDCNTWRFLKFSEEFNVHNILPAFKKEGNDWFAIFNPKVNRVLDFTLMRGMCACVLSRKWNVNCFNSVVCCVCQEDV
jgi:hypothetical protein